MYNSRGVYFQNGIPTEHAVIINRTFARVNIPFLFSFTSKGDKGPDTRATQLQVSVCIPKWINANYMYIFC